MAVETTQQDSGLSSLMLLLRFFGSNPNVEQIRQRGMGRIGVPDMLRCAQELGFKANIDKPTWECLVSAVLPGIAALQDGGFLILGKVADDKVLILQPDAPRPEVITRAQFETIWDGRVVLMVRRGALSRALTNSIRLFSGLRIGSLLRSMSDHLMRLVRVMRQRTYALVRRVQTSFNQFISHGDAVSIDPSAEVT